jgi:putative flippase GtrA
MSDTVFAQLFRYILVGSAVYAVDVGLFAFLLALPGGVHYLIANGASKAVAATVGFLLHKHFTFRWEQAGGALGQSLAYALLFLFNLGLSTALLSLSVDLLALPALLSKIVTDVIVVALSFALSRSFVFRRVSQYRTSGAPGGRDNLSGSDLRWVSRRASLKRRSRHSA